MTTDKGSRSGDFRDDRLPPPAFPPGARKYRTVITPDRAPDAEEGEAEGGRIPEEAVFSPDDAGPARREPDRETIAEAGPEEGSDSGKLPEPSEQPDDILEAADILEKVARGLRSKGTVALMVGPETSRFEAVLNGFLAGYLGGMKKKGDEADLAYSEEEEETYKL
jgi:hypothetical protein